MSDFLHFFLKKPVFYGKLYFFVKNPKGMIVLSNMFVKWKDDLCNLSEGAVFLN